MTVERYRSRPTFVEAVQFDGANVAELATLLGWPEDDDYAGTYDNVYITEGDGELEVTAGDYVLNSADGVVILDPDEFHERYERDA